MLNFIFKLIDILTFVIKAVTTAVTVVTGVVTTVDHVGRASARMADGWDDLLALLKS